MAVASVEPVRMAGIELTFEPNVPVVGQVLFLDAIDFLYSLFALADEGTNDDPNLEDRLGELLTNLPGKLLPKEHVLTVAYARTGSVKEGLSGLAKATVELVKFIATYRERLEQEKIATTKKKVQVISEELLPLMKKLQKLGRKGSPAMTKQQIEGLLAKVYQLIDEVLVGALNNGALKIDTVPKLPKLGRACPTCHGFGSLP